jgi:colicin import membrane protein
VTAFNGYPFSIFFAVLFHSLIIGFVLYFERAETEVLDVVRPPVVKAILVNENPQARNEQVQQQREIQRVQEQRAADQRREEQLRQQQAEAAAQAEQRRVQEQQRLQAEQRQQAEQKQQEERRQQEVAAQQAAERKRQEDQQREEQRKREEQRQQEVAAREAAEKQREDQARSDAESRERAETEAEMVMAYTAIIHDLVQRQWSRPPSARNGMVVVLRIRLAPTGDIVGNVEVVRSSGDFAFDRAAETAVLKVNRFSELQGMPPRMFERNFRSLLLTFRPEDLLN